MGGGWGSLAEFNSNFGLPLGDRTATPCLLMVGSDSAVVRRRGALLGLAAAASFGVSAPLAKWLLSSFQPQLLAGLLYLGAAAGLWLHRLFCPSTQEARLVRADLPWLFGVVVLGGVLGPLLMLLGLARVSAWAGSLLLNLEAPFTMLIAVAVFREHLGRRALAAATLILAGALVLKLPGAEVAADTLGVLLLAAACVCWGLDNNLTQKLTLRDPFAIVRVKTLAAGLFKPGLALAMLSGPLPSGAAVLAALLLGSVSYGLSVVLDAYALRAIGAAREAAYFATAPFLGAVLSWLLFRQPLGVWDALALFVMGLGVVLMLRERHGHSHTHEEVEHEHLHEHDAHHQHVHGPGDPFGELHSHRHEHRPLEHDHPHLSDLHHRHDH